MPLDPIMRIIGLFVNKKKVVGWIAAPLLVLGAAAAAMSTQEFKDAVCAAPVIEVPK